MAKQQVNGGAKTALSLIQVKVSERHFSIYQRLISKRIGIELALELLSKNKKYRHLFDNESDFIEGEKAQNKTNIPQQTPKKEEKTTQCDTKKATRVSFADGWI